MEDDLKKFFLKKQILITGGLGFIGSNLALKLVKLGAQVTIIDSLLPNLGGNLFNIKPIQNLIKINISDIRDKHSLEYLVLKKDIVFNLAGTLSHVDSMTDPFTDLEINTVAQLNLLEVCRSKNPEIKILFAGTRNQYGKAKYLPVDENHPQNPTDINGINCVAGEQLHLLYNQVYKIRTCSLRLSNTYGPRHQMKHSRQGVLNWFIKQLLAGETIKLFGTGEQIRDINYVEDVVEAFLLAAASNKSWGQAYNLGGISVSLKKFVETVISVLGKGKYTLTPFPNNRKVIEIGDYIADYTKITQDLGWKPKTDLKIGIKKTLDYYLKYHEKYR